MRTIFYHFILAGTFIYGLFFRYPYLLFVKGEKAYKFVCKIAKNWGKNLIWASGSKVKVIYKNNSENEMKKWPLIGRWMRRFDCIFLDRKNARQGMKDMKEAIDKIKKGHSYVIFPEGSRSKDGKIGEFKKGSFKLATDTKARIFPIALVGTYEIQSRKSLKVTPNKNVKIIVDNPINLEDLSKEDQKRVHEIVNEIVKNNFAEYNNKN